VYAAATVSPHLLLGNPQVVAVKLFKPHAAQVSVLRAPCPATLEAFAHRAVAGHPNIIAFHGMFNYFKRRYIVTEYVAGGDLRDAHNLWGGGMPLTQALDIVRQLARALDHMHCRGFAHADLKPENVLLAQPFSDQGPNQVKLADFGLAVPFATSRSGRRNAHVRGGTSVYMAPEALLGEAHDPSKSDVFTLGVMAYELVTGSRPFKRAGENRVLAQEAQLRSIHRGARFNGDEWNRVDRNVQRTLRKMLHPNWRRRPSAAQVVHVLDQFCK